MRRQIIPMLLLASLPLVTVPARAEIVNGSFDPLSVFSGSRLLVPGDAGIPGWAVVSGSVRWVAGTPDDPAATGDAFFVELADGTLRQSFATTPGEWYRVDATTQSPAGTAVSILVDGAMVGILRAGYGTHPVWVKQGFRFIANSTWTTLDVARAPGSAALARLGHLSVTGTLRVTSAETATWGWLKQAYR